MARLNRKVRVASLSIISNTALIIFKVIAGVLSGSVSIISEAIHSGMDLIASIIAFFSVKESAKPADEKHPYGHGKVENMSALIEGLLIFVAAIMIITEVIKKLIEPTELEQTNIAMEVMFISAFINWMVSRKLYKVAKEEDSMALEADALHLKTDVYTSLGVGLGILLIKLTGFTILDPIVAILVALLIIKEAWVLCKNAFDFLLDSKLPDKEVAEVKKILLNHSHQFIDYHKLKTRRSGNMKHIDFHITVPADLTAKEIHDIIGSLKKDMNETLKNTRVYIHVDPSQ
ncbi:cation diffusion facilitator family transporter [Schinkia azotoformans]|uniref:cation diffusion facilitator family transporter n=1 Tax=Schinkia azotoformans TaxID=1454 RepID=UPI002DBCF9FC|nr:cation diffusion facilitator family transporter [Schinkia azotoformans]MEC1722685.1 cation diffusion facilitator family transporter [Schinkia azotoformans]MED4413035.1 cation diffusion facilitator family transporter [Schinkia azotoformans]